MLTKIKNWIATPHTMKPRTAKLSMDTLEAKEVPATLILLDFNGVSNRDLRTVVSQVQSPPALSDPANSGRGIDSFVAAFDTLNREYSRYRFLDFNGDRRLNATDANLAIAEIIKRVEQDFAPYDIRVARSDTTSIALNQMRLNSGRDALVIMSGDGGAGGQAMMNTNNSRDDAVVAGGTLGIAQRMSDGFLNGSRTVANARDAFLNMFATFITHEAGHSFGLEHVDVDRMPSADNRNVMDPFLWDRNTGFWNMDVPVLGGGTQNQHQHLTRVLGASANPWAAVLRPGELTIQGSRHNENVVVTPMAGAWNVQTGWYNGSAWVYKNYNLDDSTAPGMSSMNQFDQRITSIRYNGGDGNDRFITSVNTIAPVYADGGKGNDTLYASHVASVLNGGDGNDTLMGSSGSDTLNGGNGHDYLYGYDGNDVLDGGAGNDYLFGLNGNDTLHGSSGRDILRGGNDNDYLNGGEDNTRDVLYGEAGSDTFVRFKDTFLGITIDSETETNYDLNSLDRLITL